MYETGERGLIFRAHRQFTKQIIENSAIAAAGPIESDLVTDIELDE
jgi:hypothetical protein